MIFKIESDHVDSAHAESTDVIALQNTPPCL